MEKSRNTSRNPRNLEIPRNPNIDWGNPEIPGNIRISKSRTPNKTVAGPSLHTQRERYSIEITGLGQYNIQCRYSLSGTHWYYQ